jgi:hypothetical protein
VVQAWLGAGRREALAAYQAPALRRRFRGRMLMRLGYARIQSRVGAELALGALRSPILSPVAAKVFFGRGSFPDLDLTRLLEETDQAGSRRALPWRARFLTNRSSGPGSAPPATPAGGRSTR